MIIKKSKHLIFANILINFKKIVVIKIPKCSNFIDIHTHLKNLQVFSWC
jgi:hypothetical protein